MTWSIDFLHFSDSMLFILANFPFSHQNMFKMIRLYSSLIFILHELLYPIWRTCNYNFTFYYSWIGNLGWFWYTGTWSIKLQTRSFTWLSEWISSSWCGRCLWLQWTGLKAWWSSFLSTDAALPYRWWWPGGTQKVAPFTVGSFWGW